MLEKNFFYFLLFIIYSFLGWLMEVIRIHSLSKKWVNRGFLIGPYCPIYGSGCILIILLLESSKNDLLGLFLKAILICSLLEYFTSYLMEKVFNARWWDYSEKPFNINGRICLETMIPFGILGTLMIYVINPFIAGKLELIPKNILIIIAILVFILFLIDFIVSFKVIFETKMTIKKEVKDNTEEITKIVKEKLIKKSVLYRRLVHSFPNFSIKMDEIKEKVAKIKPHKK